MCDFWNGWAFQSSSEIVAACFQIKQCLKTPLLLLQTIDLTANGDTLGHQNVGLAQGQVHGFPRGCSSSRYIKHASQVFPWKVEIN